MKWKEEELNWMERYKDKIDNYQYNMTFLADTFLPSPRVLLLCHYLVFGSEGILLTISGSFIELRLRFGPKNLSRVLFRESIGGLSSRTKGNFIATIINLLTFNGVPKEIANDIGHNSELMGETL